MSETPKPTESIVVRGARVHNLKNIDFEVQQRRFTTLRKGGPGNRWEVDGIVVQSGQRFRKTGKTWLPVTFQQR